MPSLKKTDFPWPNGPRMPGLGLDDAALPEGREPASRRSTPSAAPGGTILGGFLGGNRGDFTGLNGDLMILMLIAL